MGPEFHQTFFKPVADKEVFDNRKNLFAAQAVEAEGETLARRMPIRRRSSTTP